MYCYRARKTGMKRSHFIKSMGILTAATMVTNLKTLANSMMQQANTAFMPVLFLGHGSPMNAIETNKHTLAIQQIGKQLQKPKAILCISAHWETRGTFVTAMAKPETIHDFRGFPQELFNFQYPAPGSKEFAQLTSDTVNYTSVGLTEEWGLDHGAWSVLTHLFPLADVPVYQMSLNYNQSPEWHYELGKDLQALRSKGVLIVSSGNIVHNLGKLNWQNPNSGFDWAIEANDFMKKKIAEHDYKSLVNYSKQGTAMNLAIPTPDHYLPLLYTLSLKQESETITTFNDDVLMGSIAMTSFMIH